MCSTKMDVYVVSFLCLGITRNIDTGFICPQTKECICTDNGRRYKYSTKSTKWCIIFFHRTCLRGLEVDDPGFCRNIIKMEMVTDGIQ